MISALGSRAGFLARRFRLALVVLAALALGGCAAPATPPSSGPSGSPNVLAAETFLADIAQNVAGDRLTVKALIPIGVDPHSFEPTPSDVRTVADSTLLIINGAGFEAFLAPLLKNAGGRRTVIEAATGLATRAPQPGEHPEGERRLTQRATRTSGSTPTT